MHVQMQGRHYVRARPKRRKPRRDPFSRRLRREITRNWPRHILAALPLVILALVPLAIAAAWAILH